MVKPRTIQNKKTGKFEGSVGVGKTVVPTVTPIRPKVAPVSQISSAASYTAPYDNIVTVNFGDGRGFINANTQGLIDETLYLNARLAEQSDDGVSDMDASVEDYVSRMEKLTNGWKRWLAAEYAVGLPPEAQDIIFAEALQFADDANSMRDFEAPDGGDVAIALNMERAEEYYSRLVGVARKLLGA